MARSPRKNFDKPFRFQIPRCNLADAPIEFLASSPSGEPLGTVKISRPGIVVRPHWLNKNLPARSWDEVFKLLGPRTRTAFAAVKQIKVLLDLDALNEMYFRPDHDDDRRFYRALIKMAAKSDPVGKTISAKAVKDLIGKIYDVEHQDLDENFQILVKTLVEANQVKVLS